ncbi:hypothetical protein [Endozoicomonas sp. ONNA1]|uniref:hypothetical protein n=1 Tax=Endozoicomonas sp. ONNA1 TaxID=2828740 RepID=UPI0021493307|nr:hypothetical protein [Endozoicomonas sp. ONNA1]
MKTRLTMILDDKPVQTILSLAPKMSLETYNNDAILAFITDVWIKSTYPRLPLTWMISPSQALGDHLFNLGRVGYNIGSEDILWLEKVYNYLNVTLLPTLIAIVHRKQLKEYAFYRWDKVRMQLIFTGVPLLCQK